MKIRRFFTAIIVLTMVLSLFPAENVYAADETHIIINQVYGGAEDGYASHSFIELYNPTEQAVDLSGWSIQYKSSVEGGASDAWQKLELTGWIGAGDYYLVRCGAVTDTSNVIFNVPEGNQEWDVQIYNKGFSVVLTAGTTLLGDDFAGDVSGRTDYVDCMAAQGNDATEVQKPVAYETGYSAIQSKKKGVIRSNFADTNDNAADVEDVNYSKAVSDDKAPHRGSYEGKKNQTITLSTANPLELKAGESALIGASAQTTLTYSSSNEAVASVDADGTVTANKAGKAQITITAAEDDAYVSASTVLEVLVKQNFTLKTDGFENGNAVTLNKLGSYITGISNPEGGVAEIVSYDKKNNNAWVVNGATGKLDIVSLAPVTGKTGTELTAFSIDVKELTESKDSTFSYGDMTSVCVNSELGIAAVALQDADFMKDGRVAVLSTEGEFIALINAGCQPDMVTFTPDGTKILTANEGEPRNGGLGDAATDPKGSVTIITLNMDNIAASESVNVSFDAFDAVREQLVASNVILSKGAAPSLDLEPEYIAADNNKAYIALQEANAIAVLDIKTKQYDGIYSLGYKDLSDSRNAADVEDDGEYKADTYQDTVAAYMPDGIALYSVGSKTYLLTANEGDAREWGDYKNEDKVKLITASGEETNKVRVIKTDVTDGLPEGKKVMFGGRS
ncbi:MAG: choice-of-anchor I domain-containing protein, partial [Lachnospiraceae bacterium]